MGGLSADALTLRNQPHGRRVRFRGRTAGEVQDFLADFLGEDRQSQFGRIAGLAVDNDGALLLSEDTNSVIYRISHEGGPQRAEASD